MEKKLFELHEENTEFTRQLEFYKDEMKIMQIRIEEIAKKNNRKEVLMKVEQFQNRLIIQRNNLDELYHNINEKEELIRKNINANPIASDHRKMQDQEQNRENVKKFTKHMANFRIEMNEFLAKHL